MNFTRRAVTSSDLSRIVDNALANGIPDGAAHRRPRRRRLDAEIEQAIYGRQESASTTRGWWTARQ